MTDSTEAHFQTQESWTVLAKGVGCPVRWGIGGRKVGEVVEIDKDGMVVMEITDQETIDLLRTHTFDDIAFGFDPAKAVPRD